MRLNYYKKLYGGLFIVSKSPHKFQRSGLRLHQTITILGDNVEKFSLQGISLGYKSAKEYFNAGEHEENLKRYLQYAFQQEITDPDDFFIIVRSLLILKKREEALSLFKTNYSFITKNRILLFEYILLCGREGDYASMNDAIYSCEDRFGADGIHAKILQALIHSNSPKSTLDNYITKMKQRYKENAPYEILRAAYPSRHEILMREYYPQLKKSPRHQILSLRILFIIGEKNEALELLSQLNPNIFDKNQAREIIKNSLQLNPKMPLKKWLDIANLSKEEIELEFARSQISLGISEGDFATGLEGLKLLLSHENPTITQILRLIRTSDDYKGIFDGFLQVAGTNGFMLQMVIEFGMKYSFEDISLSALSRLEGLMLCDIDNDDYQINYIMGVKNSGDVSLMARAYGQLQHIQNPRLEVFEFASYFSQIQRTFDLGRDEVDYLDVNAIEHLVLGKIAKEFNSPSPMYEPINNHALIVNNSLKFGGAERQVVRCLANNNFSKGLVVWNIQVNNSENSFIDEVRKMGIDIYDYSRKQNSKRTIYTEEVQQLMELIPTTPPLNPGITQKISNLIQIIMEQKPTTLHLWQDTTSILGAIAGILCGVPKIVMSARSLPPFALPTNSFPNKGPNYYYNNRFVRKNYQDILKNKRVYLSHNSQNGLEKYVEWLGGFEDRMLLLQNGFDLSQFKSYPITQKTNAPFRIGTVFRFVDVKQPLLWLDVAKEVVKKIDEPVVFTIVGDGPLLEESMKYVREIGIADKVEFLGYRDDVVDVLNTFDLFLLTSLIEGLPNVLIEAQAMGIPVVSTNAGGANETFIEGRSGYLVTTFEANDIADAVLQVIRDKDFQKEASVYAKNYINSMFSLETMHRNLEKILFEGVQ